MFHVKHRGRWLLAVAVLVGLYAMPCLVRAQFATEVLCCCNTMNGQCCNWVSFCSGIVEGCVCQ